MPNYFENSTLKYINLKLPKFDILSQYDFKNTIMKLGVTYIFSHDRSDFGRMTNHSVVIGNIIQVANISVTDMDETALTFEDLMQVSISEAQDFHANRPFIFIIYSYSYKIVLFSAIVTSPNPAML
ncbi:Glia-derived nexin [Thelohanellus kitauei]|uniref:Glia-derived nexin n=1 Tax=Thelohanellus kitauei TaxID=669202 RepID=A0A0C2ILQ4_THEKT|nr:Glia-derived nexin [Thelohanellus kitauei]